MASPRSVDIAITGRCNLKCRYCYYADEMVALSDLPTKKWLSFFEQLGVLGVMRVCITGGEPFTRHDLFELIDGVTANRMRYNILTNGTLINEEILAKFNEVEPRRRRLDYIQISIDGSCAEIHNISRPGSFDRAIRAVRLLKAANFPLAVRITINRHNIHDLENTVSLLLDDIGLPSVGTNEVASIGAGCENREHMVLSAQERLEAMQILKDLNIRYPGRLQAQAGPQAKTQGYTEMEKARATGIKTNRWGMGYLTGCGCAFSKLSILHDGTIVPCHILHGLHIGNISTSSIQVVWHDSPVLEALRARRQIPMDQVEGCEDCEWNAYCNGSCPGTAYEFYGDINRANPQDCYRRFLFELGQDKIQV